MPSQIIKNKNTRIPYTNITYIFNKPVVSSDLNEGNDSFNKSLFDYLLDFIPSNSIKVIVDKDTTTASGASLIINKFKYLLKNQDSIYYFGAIDKTISPTHPITITVSNDSLAANTQYKVYIYYKYVQVDGESEVYEDGIRSNDHTTSVLEYVTENHILDMYVGEESSVRNSLEFTFTIEKSSLPIPVINGYSSGTEIAVISTDSSSDLDISTALLADDKFIASKGDIDDLYDYDLHSINLLVANWSQDSEYNNAWKQEVNIDSNLVRMKSVDIQPCSYAGQSYNEYNINMTNYSLITSVDKIIGPNGYISKLIFYCNYEKPSTDFSIYVKIIV